MKASETSILTLLKNAPQFVIPIYQRNYSWTEQQCRQLWDDIVRAGGNASIKGHFIGSIVSVEAGLSAVSDKSPVLVIDGQQRLTTVTLLLAALVERLGDDEPVEGCSRAIIRDYYLKNLHQKGEKEYKLILSKTDKDSLLHILGAPEPHEQSLAITRNFAFFKDQLQHCPDLAVVWQGIVKLVVVDIALNREYDNPQLIFESMNSTGLALSQADLIRNFLLMGLETELQKRLYEHYWRPMEHDFGQAAYQEHFDAFMRHFLTTKNRTFPRFDEVYAEFKRYAQRQDIAGDIEGLIADLRTNAGYYCRLVLDKEPDKELRFAFADLRDLRAEVAYPLLLEWYKDYVDGLWKKEELLEATRLLESYVFRRAACAIPANSLMKTFATFNRHVKKERYLDSVKAHFARLASYRRFPNNEEFRRELQARDLYTNRLRGYWPRRMENFGRKERISVAEYSVEHIMPQNSALSAQWQADLGPDWKRVQEQWLHTLGNLTLTGYNSEYSDKSFAEKRDMAGGFKESPLHLNQGLGAVAVWNEDAIRERAGRLADLALKVWPYPDCPPDMNELDAARPEYTEDDHSALQLSAIRALYDALRREVLALDPAVSMEVLKVYIAFKAETNFLDVEPRRKRLLLFLNMRFPDMDDPKQLCEDVTYDKHHGNGDVRISFDKLEKLPYIMSLVRQAFNAQMDGES